MNFEVGAVRSDLLGRAGSHDSERGAVELPPQALGMSARWTIEVPSKAGRTRIWPRQSRDQQFFLRNLLAIPRHSILGVQFAGGPQTSDI
jgi:hypothetical protein